MQIQRTMNIQKNIEQWRYTDIGSKQVTEDLLDFQEANC